MRYLLAPALALATGLAPAPPVPVPVPVPAPLTVFVVRHAERGTDDPRDPALSEAGRRRASELARVLGDAGVTHLFSSEFRRTRETLEPLARQAGLTPVVIPAAATDSLVALIQGLNPGSRVVVASHSNLVHVIVGKLAGAAPPPLTERDYDRLFVVTVTGAGAGLVATLRYGEP